MPVHAQTDDLIQREIERALERRRWVLGPLYVTPALRSGSGYDSNAILAGDDTNPDVNFFTAPAADVVLPLGNRAMVSVYEELNFVYFRELAELRDIFNVTRVGGAFGGKQLIVRVGDEFRSEKVRPSRELDVPVDQRSNRVESSVGIALGWRHELSFSYRHYRVLVGDSSATVGGVPVKSLLDRTEDTIGVSFARELSLDTRAIFEAELDRKRFDDAAVGRDSSGYAFYGGATFSPTGNVRGRGRVGYRKLDPEVTTTPGFSGVVGEGDVRVGLGRRFELRGVYVREPVPSVVSSNLFVVTGQAGVFLDIYFLRDAFLRPGIVFTRNNYHDLSADDERVGELLIRRERTMSLSINRYLAPEWLARATFAYSNRELSSDSGQENRLRVSVELTTTF